jgi:hypothetical protein
LGSLGKFVIDKLILASKRLDILGELLCFSCFNLDDLELVVNLLSHVLVFRPE